MMGRLRRWKMFIYNHVSKPRKGIWFIHFFFYFCPLVITHVSRRSIGVTTLFKYRKKIKIIRAQARFYRKIVETHGFRSERTKNANDRIDE